MKEILVLCPFSVDRGLLSKAALLSGGALRALVPAGESNIAAEYGANRIFEWNAPEIGDESAFAAFLAETIRRWGQPDCAGSGDGADAEHHAHACLAAERGTDGDCTALRMEGERLIQTPPGLRKFPDGGYPLLKRNSDGHRPSGNVPAGKQAVKTPTVETITYTPNERVKLRSFGSFARKAPVSGRRSS